MKNSAMVLLLLLVALLLGLAYNVWQSRQVAVYQLEVINRSAEAVDYIRLFGTGAQAEARLKLLNPGRSALISVLLNKQGGLRYEVSQGGNRIDTFINKNIKAMTSLQQQLIIHPGHRYIISDYDQLSTSD